MRAYKRISRRARAVGRRWREVRLIARALQSARHPVLAQLVPIRRCNLACSYCNEFDDHSKPVDTRELFDRIDRLAWLGTGVIELSGGEPLLHPDLDQVIRRIRRHRVLAGLLTNGYLLGPERIERLNDAGLDHLQISIDNVTPDAVSRKSLSRLDRKLVLLAERAAFGVNINCVLGAGIRNPHDALTIAERARELGFTVTVGLIHDGSGQLIPLDAEQQRAYREFLSRSGSFYSVARHNPFQRNLARGQPNVWHCRAGARYLYICEDGLVHWCSQQRGHPGIPLREYGPDDLAREFDTPKSCAPFCTVSCVHRVALVDRLRERPRDAVTELLRDGDAVGAAPATVRLLEWMFVTGRPRRFFRTAALKVLGVR